MCVRERERDRDHEEEEREREDGREKWRRRDRLNGAVGLGWY